ncbi:MAG: alpha/beta hydrolase [bacterium]
MATPHPSTPSPPPAPQSQAPGLPEDLEHTRIRTNGVELHAVLAGPVDGPLVLLLHGFPEFWYGWRYQLGALAQAGYRVVAPDQRGYNTSDKPDGLSAYTLRELGRDVVGVLDHFGVGRGLLVGHDWGGAVAWSTALQHPDRVARLAVLNLPHPIVFARAVRSYRQLRRSWYILAFQVPWLPEWFLRRNDFGALTTTLRHSIAPGRITAQDLDVYRQAYGQPGALTAMLAWYRAAVRRPDAPLRQRRVAVPTCLIWGKRDTALGWEMAAPSLDYCDNGRLHLLEQAGHFVQHDAWDEVNRLLLAHLGPAVEHGAEARVQGARRDGPDRHGA